MMMTHLLIDTHANNQLIHPSLTVFATELRKQDETTCSSHEMTKDTYRMEFGIILG